VFVPLNRQRPTVRLVHLHGFGTFRKGMFAGDCFYVTFVNT
jgi:hypothetical protein